MEPDPIAENQTDVTIATLMTRDDGDPLMNRAVASCLAYVKKLGVEMADMKASLWSPDSLDRLISAKHERSCGGCDVRKWVEEFKAEQKRRASAAAAKPSLWSLLLSERGLLIIVVVLFALMCARLTLGPQGYQDVTTTMRPGSGGK